MERRLAAILSADVQGYSRLMSDNEGATITTLTAYREVMTSVTQQHHGRVVDSPGDNLLAEFPSAVEAVTAAIGIQKTLSERNDELPPNRQMHYRIGINVGDVVAESERIYGDGVNIAARLESLADGGGVSVSGTVYDQVTNKLDLEFRFEGEQFVKNISYPVRVYKVMIKAEPASPDISRVVSAESPNDRDRENHASPLAVPDKPSIAVLPFTNMSNDPEQEYFIDGMTEDLITDLSQISGLFVVARNSVFTYKGQPVKVQHVRQDLGVRYVLEGSIRKSGGRIRISAQLIDAESGGHLWAQRYDRDLDDIFVVQDEVTEEIVRSLKVKLTNSELTRLEQSPTQNVEAYDCYWRGAEQFNQRTPASNLEARRLFERAITIDPDYASAVAYLSRTYISQWANSWNPDDDALDRSVALGAKAVALDNNLPLAHLALGFAYLWHRDFDRAIDEARRAVKLNPNDAESCAALADILIYAGEPDEAITLLTKAQQFDPHYPVTYLFNLARSYYHLEDYQAAVTLFKRVLTRNPEHLSTHGYLAATYFEIGQLAESKSELDELNRLNPAIKPGSWKHIPYQDPSVNEKMIHVWETLLALDPGN